MREWIQPIKHCDTNFFVSLEGFLTLWARFTWHKCVCGSWKDVVLVYFQSVPNLLELNMRTKAVWCLGILGIVRCILACGIQDLLVVNIIVFHICAQWIRRTTTQIWRRDWIHTNCKRVCPLAQHNLTPKQADQFHQARHRRAREVKDGTKAVEKGEEPIDLVWELVKWNQRKWAFRTKKRTGRWVKRLN